MQEFYNDMAILPYGYHKLESFPLQTLGKVVEGTTQKMVLSLVTSTGLDVSQEGKHFHGLCEDQRKSNNIGR